MQEITVGKIYKHYKGNVYKIIALGKHSETEEDMIVYQMSIRAIFGLDQNLCGMKKFWLMVKKF